ncbi:hypothetical protein FRC00_005676 [Tulasnella sp. 408]|nr:hypothetical protein FRC00_005676 [Tulasnella sp. 408]
MNSPYFADRSLLLGLPQEIILMILLDVVEEEGEISWHERTRVQLICRALRDFVNLTPSFWSHISVLQPKKLWQRHIDMSSQLGLTVACNFTPEHESHASFLSTILPQAHRIHSLSCNINRHCKTVIIEVITRAALSLRDLRLFSTTEWVGDMDGIPLDGMPRLETIDFSDIILKPHTWCKVTGLRVVKLEETDWVDEISTFLDFLKQNDQLEKFHYSFEENVHLIDTLGPQILPTPYDTILLPSLTHLTLYSIPAFHLLTILQHVSLPPHSYINATLADSFPPDHEQPLDFVVPLMTLLVAWRPPSSLELVFDGEEAYVAATEQRWNLGFYNNAPDIEPREEAYRIFLQQIPPGIRVLISSVRIISLEHVGLLAKALSENPIHLITFDCPLNKTALAALWMDRSRGWDGFCLPKLQSITFRIWRYSTAGDIHTLRDLLQAYKATKQGNMQGLDAKIVVPMCYDQGDIQAALEDPILLSLGPLIERVAKDELAMDDEAEFNGTFEVVEEAVDSDDEEDVHSDEILRLLVARVNVV